ncbi:hypothetical protein LTR56_004884 [Elasticomyces elasticus]|nr:hypothetical protein LTR56_004884 [Elasticomyces elasticus]KAK3664658.1 hypothetical protein LTR22_004526 [Elasticomyces elasticus]KAK5760368.1 hypothetical protein LTS12_009582 [Elasticomyces elasticus]
MAPIMAELLELQNATASTTPALLPSTPNNYDHTSDMHNILFVCLSIATTVLVACWQNRRKRREAMKANDAVVELNGLAANRCFVSGLGQLAVTVPDTEEHVQSAVGQTEEAEVIAPELAVATG